MEQLLQLPQADPKTTEKQQRQHKQPVPPNLCVKKTNNHEKKIPWWALIHKLTHWSPHKTCYQPCHSAKIIGIILTIFAIVTSRRQHPLASVSLQKRSEEPTFPKWPHSPCDPTSKWIHASRQMEERIFPDQPKALHFILSFNYKLQPVTILNTSNKT